MVFHLLAALVSVCLLASGGLAHEPLKHSAQMTRHPEPRFPPHFTHLTLKSGRTVGDKLNSLTLGSHGPILLTDVALLEGLAHMNRERIPERVVHAKGAAAFGEFELTDPTIADFCKAAVFSDMGKRTPVAARFSLVAGESGYPDTIRDVRGFAVKFYTEAGNWDIVGNNLPVFFVRDPINFPSFVHTQKRNPKTHLKDPDAFWEYVALRPETLHTMIMLFSDRGTPDGFRHMNGFGVNTFKLVNAADEAFYAKFHWITNQGTKNLTDEGAIKLAGENPDYYLADLQEAINAGDFPSWTLKFQVMPLAEAVTSGFDVFDVTKVWPVEKYPLIEIGKMTLKHNPTNWFAQVEQLTFSPANMVPGVEASPDRMLQGRMFSYPDAQRYRLGVNYFDIPVNQPRCPFMTPTYVDGVTTRRDFGNGTVPTYVPSDKFVNMMKRNQEAMEHAQHFDGHIGRFDQSSEDNYSQPRDFYHNELNDAERERLASNIAAHISGVTNPTVLSEALGQWRTIDEHLASDIEAALAA